MLQFNITKGKVVIDPASLTIDALKNIWNQDRTKTKEKATNFLTYIHLISQIDPDAPFAQSPYSEVKQLAAGNTWPEMKPRLEAFVRYLDMHCHADEIMREYQRAFETPDRRTERIFDKKIDQLQELLDQTNPKISEQKIRGETKFSSNTKYITDVMKELSKLMDEREALRMRIMKKTEEDLRMMGSKKESIMEKKHRTSAK